MDSLELDSVLYSTGKGGGQGDKVHGGSNQGEQMASDAERTGADTDLGMSTRAGQKGMFRFGSRSARCLRKTWD